MIYFQSFAELFFAACTASYERIEIPIRVAPAAASSFFSPPTIHAHCAEAVATLARNAVSEEIDAYVSAGGWCNLNGCVFFILISRSRRWVWGCKCSRYRKAFGVVVVDAL